MAQYKLCLPAMGESVNEATVTQWLKNEGDSIAADEAVLEVATDKVDTEVPSEVSGVLIKKLVQDNEVVAVGSPMALIETDEDVDQDDSVMPPPTPEVDEKSQAVEEATSLISQATEVVAEPQTPASKGETYYSPLVKSIAKEEGISDVELSGIIGTGKSGRVTKKDIFSYLENRNVSKPVATPPPPAPVNFSGSTSVTEMSRMEQLIADHMHKSLQTSAHVQSFIEVDVTALWDWRENVKTAFQKRQGEKLTFTPIFMMLTAQALGDFPLLNASVEGSKIIQKKNINLGMATALPDGNLIVPVIKDADQLSLLGFARKVNDLANRARNGNLQPDDVQDGTYTVTNIGMFDSLMGTPIINQPQVGILALGAIRKVPAVVETDQGDFIGIRRKMIISHSYDHRIINGAMGGLFIKKMKELIENWDTTQTV
ncbi:MAG: dihydrolipoamide acetyltransferase family protein [Flavobacteriaceae bacterium]